MKKCNTCSHSAVCDKAKHIENYRIEDCEHYSGWVSIENGFPEDGNYITFTDANGKDNGVLAQKLVTTTIRGQKVRRWEWNCRISPWTVTHYMRLPEPPKVGV